jgi:hypothetical protein
VQSTRPNPGNARKNSHVTNKDIYCTERSQFLPEITFVSFCRPRKFRSQSIYKTIDEARRQEKQILIKNPPSLSNPCIVYVRVYVCATYNVFLFQLPLPMNPLSPHASLLQGPTGPLCSHARSSKCQTIRSNSELQPAACASRQTPMQCDPSRAFTPGCPGPLPTAV